MCEDNYKYIVWVDDFDNNNVLLDSMPMDEEWDFDDVNGDVHLSDIKNTFDEKYISHVQLIIDIPDALKYIDKNINKIQCVILDVNLNKTLNSEQKKQVQLLCENKGVLTGEDIGYCGGYYIYLYLLKSGFPTDKICMFTGNKGIDNLTGKWEIKFENAGIFPPRSIIRSDKEKLNFWLNNLFCNEYYRSRLVVYIACEYWKNFLLKRCKTEDIEFNKIYYEVETAYLIEKNSFIEMLERIERLFPVLKPESEKTLYCQALQMLTIFHEESAKIENLDKSKEKYSEIRKYHQAVRNFRNWAAHNQFATNEIDTEIFLYIFIVTLRTYFGTEKRKLILKGNSFDWYNEYEEIVFNIIFQEKFDKEIFKDKYIKEFNRHFEKVNQYSDKRNSCWDCKDFSSLLLVSGRCKCNYNQEKMHFSDLLLNIIDPYIFQETRIKNNYEPIKDAYGYKMEMKYTYTYVIKNDIDYLNIEEMKKNEPFKALAYILFCVKGDE